MQGIKDFLSIVQNSQATLFILCGFPYSGKSYIAKEICEKTGIALISIDNIFHSHGFDWNSNHLPDAEEWQKIFNESYEQTKGVLVRGGSVIYDSTNQTVSSRDVLRKVAYSAGADACVFYVKTSIDIVWRRWEENKKNPSRPIIKKELVQNTIDMFEEPTETEKVWELRGCD